MTSPVFPFPPVAPGFGPGRPQEFGEAAASPTPFPAANLIAGASIVLNADLSADPATWVFTDISSFVRGQTISKTVGRRDENSRVTTARVSLVLDNRDGRFSRRNPSGAYYGQLSRNTPIRLTINPGNGIEYVRFEGYVNEWPTRWSDKSTTDSTVTIVCAGILRRLGQGSVIRSPLFRTISGITPLSFTPIYGPPVKHSFPPLAYWPLEEGGTATRIASGLVGGQAIGSPGLVSFGAESTLPGSAPLATLAAGASITFPVPAYTDHSQWVISVCLKFASRPAAATTVLRADTVGGTVAYWLLTLTPGAPSELTWRAYDSNNAAIANVVEHNVFGSGPVLPTETTMFDRWWMHSCGSTMVNYPPLLLNAVYAITDGIVPLIGGGGGGGVGTHSPLKSITIMADGNADGLSVGHLAVTVDQNMDVFNDINAVSLAMYGWKGERAHTRIARLCDEEGIPLVSGAGTSAAMGPQSIETLVSLLRECEEADQGVLYESGFGLGYQSLAERYNAPTWLALDFNSRHIAELPEPADDDQRTRNKWTISRPSGSSLTAEKTTGTMGTGAGGPGVYSDSRSVNVAADTQLADQAGWRLHIGTVDEDRWPRLDISMHGTPELIPGWLNLPFGARVRVVNPPDPMASTTIDAFIEGYGETWDTRSWTAQLNTSPASPYTVGIWDDPVLGIWDQSTWAL